MNFADAAVSQYIRKNFDILQLNIIGAREVTDFDGERLSEKSFAAKYGVYSTPMVQFFGETAETLAGKPPAEREVLRMKAMYRPRSSGAPSPSWPSAPMPAPISKPISTVRHPEAANSFIVGGSRRRSFFLDSDGVRSNLQ